MTSIAELVKQVTSSYPLTLEAPSSFALFSDDLVSSDVFIKRVCHQYMHHLRGNFYDQMITGAYLPRPEDVLYAHWLLEGPFKAFADRVDLVLDPKPYFHIKDLSRWPANVLYNFCIATRTPTENPDKIITWSKLVALDINPSLAFMIAARVRSGLADDPREWKLVPYLTWYNTNHCWFDLTVNWNLFIAGEPLINKFSKNFKECPKDCTPSNIIWGQLDQVAYDKLTDQTVKGVVESFVFKQPLPEVTLSDFDFDDDDDDFWDFHDDDDVDDEDQDI